jgi:hypothetical protein
MLPVSCLVTIPGPSALQQIEWDCQESKNQYRSTPLLPFFNLFLSSTCSWKQRFRSRPFLCAKQDIVSECATLSKPYLVTNPISGGYSLPAKRGVRVQRGLRNAELSTWHRLENVKLNLDGPKLCVLQPQIERVWKAHSQWPKRPERKTISSLVRFLHSLF